MDNTLPWGGAVLVWSEETTDDMIGSTGSEVCSSTSADVSYGWGASCGWGGDGACCVWTSGEEGDDSTWIGDTGRGGEGGAVFWRFGCDLVLLGAFLLIWLGWGVSTLVWVLLVLADLLVCWYSNKSFISTNVTECWWNFGWTVKVTDEVSRAADLSWKSYVSIRWNRYELRKLKIYLESLCQGSNGNRWRCLWSPSGYLLETHIPVH